MRIESARVVVDPPSGWEAEIYRREEGGFSTLTGETTGAVVHIANFPLPAERGDFGSGAVEIMRTDDLLMVLFEYGRDSVGSPLFSASGLPVVRAEDFDPNKMQRPLPGQSGAQYFFTIEGRPFCLYVALGSHARRADLVSVVNAVLSTVTIS
jgi:hypothetical protein